MLTGLSYAWTEGSGIDLTLRVEDDGGPKLQLVDNATSAVVGSVALDQDRTVEVKGGRAER